MLGIAELTLEARELEVMVCFYTEKIGLEILKRERDRVWLAVGGRTRLGLWMPGEKEFGDEGGRHVHFAFSVTTRQLDALHHRLTAANVPVRGPVEHDGGDRSIYFEDPAGNLLEAWNFFQQEPGAGAGVNALT